MHLYFGETQRLVVIFTLGRNEECRDIFNFPSKLKCSANELYKLLSREQEGFVIESSTRQALKTKNIVIALPLDYPHFWNEQSEDDIRQQVLEDP